MSFKMETSFVTVILSLLMSKRERNAENEINWKQLHKQNIFEIGKTCLAKNHLKPTGISLRWKLTELPTFMSVISSKDNEPSSQAAWPSLTFFRKRKLLLWKFWLSVKKKWGRTDECQELKHVGDLKINLLKRNASPQLLSFYPDNIFQCNGPK